MIQAFLSNTLSSQKIILFFWINLLNKTPFVKQKGGPKEKAHHLAFSD